MNIFMRTLRTRENLFQVCGQLTETLRKHTYAVKEEIYVMMILHTPLLGLPVITDLNLVAKSCELGWIDMLLFQNLLV